MGFEYFTKSSQFDVVRSRERRVKTLRQVLIGRRLKLVLVQKTQFQFLTYVCPLICINATVLIYCIIWTGRRRRRRRSNHLPNMWDRLLKPLTSLCMPLEMLGFGRARELNVLLFVFSWQELSSPSRLPRDKEKKKEIVKRLLTEREEEGGEITGCMRGFGLMFWSLAGFSGGHRNTRLRSTADGEGKNYKSFLTISHVRFT